MHPTSWQLLFKSSRHAVYCWRLPCARPSPMSPTFTSCGVTPTTTSSTDLTAAAHMTTSVPVPLDSAIYLSERHKDPPVRRLPVHFRAGNRPLIGDAFRPLSQTQCQYAPNGLVEAWSESPIDNGNG